MIKKILFIGVLSHFLTVSWAGVAFINNNTTTFQQVLVNFSKVNKNNLPGKPINRNMLPIPFDFLLTQPLMTPGVEKYYQRTPIVQTIYAVQDQKTNCYSRIVSMLIDGDLNRNNAEVAQEKNQALIVETAVISMNFNELPDKVKAGVLTTNIPLGKLLVENQVKTTIKDRAYFSLGCNRPLSALTHCKLGTAIYGRVNTIIRADNKRWIARVIEILPGLTRKEIS